MGPANAFEDAQYRSMGRRACGWFFGIAVPASAVPITFGTVLAVSIDYSEQPFIVCGMWFISCLILALGLNWLGPAAVCWFLRVRAARAYCASPRDGVTAARAASNLHLRWRYWFGVAAIIGFENCPGAPPVTRIVNRVIYAMWAAVGLSFGLLIVGARFARGVDRIAA